MSDAFTMATAVFESSRLLQYLRDIPDYLSPKTHELPQLLDTPFYFPYPRASYFVLGTEGIGCKRRLNSSINSSFVLTFCPTFR